MSDTYTVRRATMDDVKDIHALLMENARKGLLLPRALIFLYGHVRNFLVIDDLGTEPMLKNISIEYLMAVLNHRSAKKLPYAVATNLTMAQLMERYGERIVSRLMDRARLVQLTGQDLRLAALRGNA